MTARADRKQTGTRGMEGEKRGGWRARQARSVAAESGWPTKMVGAPSDAGRLDDSRAAGDANSRLSVLPTDAQVAWRHPTHRLKWHLLDELCWMTRSRKLGDRESTWSLSPRARLVGGRVCSVGSSAATMAARALVLGAQRGAGLG